MIVEDEIEIPVLAAASGAISGKDWEGRGGTGGNEPTVP